MHSQSAHDIYLGPDLYELPLILGLLEDLVGLGIVPLFNWLTYIMQVENALIYDQIYFSWSPPDVLSHNKAITNDTKFMVEEPRATLRMKFERMASLLVILPPRMYDLGFTLRSEKPRDDRREEKIPYGRLMNTGWLLPTVSIVWRTEFVPCS